MKIAAFETKLGHSFRDGALLERALTHSSFAYEAPERASGDNEVLEFLGDSVIGLVLADYVCEAYPDRPEGELSKLKAAVASTLGLAEIALKIKLDKLVRLGKGEERSGGRKKKTILAGAFEAVMGAVYLDAGYEAARRVLRPRLAAAFKKLRSSEVVINNYKSALQEHFQKQDGPPPCYRTLEQAGPDHRKEFKVEVMVAGRVLARAGGPSKKAAEQCAAQLALRKIWGRKIKALSADTFFLKKR
ncbi:MAG: ribonuclease III [Candidatus Aminicenantes bacterium]|nr:ribonuclease III [Candidatus Aminicenantes bacterium]